jgi:hypothetical protein
MTKVITEVKLEKVFFRKVSIKPPCFSILLLLSSITKGDQVNLVSLIVYLQLNPG